MASKKIVNLALFSSMVGIVFVLGLYLGSLYAESISSSLLSEKDETITSLQSELLKEMKTDIKSPKVVPSVTPQTPVASGKGLPTTQSFKINTPKAGDRLCRGTTYTFSWDADPTQIDQVRIWLDAPMPIGPISDTPVSWNEQGRVGEGTVNWVVGAGIEAQQTMQVPDGELYFIIVDALLKKNVVETKKMGPFSIKTCEG